MVGSPSPSSVFKHVEVTFAITFSSSDTLACSGIYRQKQEEAWSPSLGK